MSEYSSCLSQICSDHSSSLSFQMALQNTRKISSVLQLLSPSPMKKKVCSVSNAKTTVEKINKIKEIKEIQQ